MKTKNQAIRSLTTQQLKELIDLAHPRTRGTPLVAHGPQAPPPQVPGRQGGVDSPPLAAASVWELKDRADALQEIGQAWPRRLNKGPVWEGGAARKRRGPNLFEQLTRMLLRKPPQRPAPRRSWASSKGAPKTGQLPATPAVPPDPARDAGRNIHAAAKGLVGETILGTVTLQDVLKELERRGVDYQPPVDQRGVLTIEESDLILTKNGAPAKLRPGIQKYLKDHQDEMAGIRNNATQPIDLGAVRMPHGFIESAGPVQANYLEVKQLHSVGDVTVEEFVHAGEIQVKGDVTAREIFAKECTVYGNVTCADTLKFTTGSTGSKQTITGNARCGHLESEDDRLVNVGGAITVKGNCSVPRLSARDLSIGWELQNAKRLFVSGNASITKLSPSIDPQAEFQGISLQEYVQQLQDSREALRQRGVRKGHRAHAENDVPTKGQGRVGATHSHQGRNGVQPNGSTQGVGL